MANTEIPAEIAKKVVKNFFGNIDFDIDKKIDNITFDVILNGSSNFDHQKNIVHIASQHKYDVNVYVHELLHAVSTSFNYDRFDVGFNKKSYKKLTDDLLLENSYGYALNEGATHSFTVDATKNRFGEINIVKSYDFCANIYKNIEKNIGKSLMKLCYVNSSVRDFISIISKAFHTDEENVLKLVLNMDAYFDTARVFRTFANNENSEDANSLLSNCYKYLAKMIYDKYLFEEKKFDVYANISTEHLKKDELKLFLDLISKVDVKNIKNNKAVTTKQYEKLAKYIISLENDKRLKNFDIVMKKDKCGEFYNFLLLNNYICDNDKLRKNILNSDIKSTLTQKIFNQNKNAFRLDKNLPDNIRTLLSTRYAVRAGVATSDFYMQKCLSNTKFAEYLKKTDEDYYLTLKELEEEKILKK